MRYCEKDIGIKNRGGERMRLEKTLAELSAEGKYYDNSREGEIRRKLAVMELCIKDILTEIYELSLEEQKMCAASLDDLAQAAAGAARGIRNPAEA